LGISNQAVTISGRATMSEKEIDRPDFVAAGTGEIRSRLKKYLESHEPRAGDLMILDMEPEGIAPRQLGEFADEKAAASASGSLPPPGRRSRNRSS
jgi:hypothetical protein